MYERSREHMLDAKCFSEKSHIVKNWLQEHPELQEQPIFSVKTIGQSEYLNCIPRLKIEENVYVKKKKERGWKKRKRRKVRNHFRNSRKTKLSQLPHFPSMRNMNQKELNWILL